MRLFFVGFGQVGRALARMLLQRDGGGFVVVGIASRDHGALCDPAGVDLAAALQAYEQGGRLGGGQAGDDDPQHLASSLGYDVLVEMTPLSVAGRGEPAITHCRTALTRGCHVVTCNKGPVAWAFPEMSRLATAFGVEFRYESTVMDGAPVFNLHRHCLPGLPITGLDGILNSTTNVAIAGIEDGMALDEALQEAQRLGIAEADPTDDVDGWDAAVKLAILSTVLLDRAVEPEQVTRQSLREVEPDRIRLARRRGTPVKMVCRAEVAGASVAASVRAEEVPADAPLAFVRGTSSLLRLRTSLPGAFVILEENPSVETTAYGVLADLLALRSATTT